MSDNILYGQTEEATYKDKEFRFKPTHLGILLERLCHTHNWGFFDPEKGLRTRIPTTTYKIGPEIINNTTFTYEVAIPQGDVLVKALEDPTYEKIIITTEDAKRIIITRNPYITKWRGNTRVLVTKFDKNGKETEKIRFRTQDLKTLEGYVRKAL